MSSAVLEIRNLDIGYGQLSVAQGLELRVGAGEIVALLGRNGVGKTTTLMTIAGVVPSLAGSIEIAGVPAVGPLHKRCRHHGVGLVTEDRAVIRALTVAENLRVGGGDVDTAFQLFPELRSVARRKAGLLSGGEQQMLALGRALATGPRLLLVDELSLGLAPLVVRRLLDALAAAASSQGVGILLVEQHPSLALSVADFGYVLGRGGLRLSGRANELSGRLDEIEETYFAESFTSPDAREPS